MQRNRTTEIVHLLRRFFGSVRKDWIAHVVTALLLEGVKVLLHLIIW
jgi:hypothetical protein